MSWKGLSQEGKITVVVSLIVLVFTMVSFIVGFLCGHFCRRKIPHGQTQFAVHYDVQLQQPYEQDLELKENVAYGQI